jgi:large conductance mechanosensitive channel
MAAKKPTVKKGAKEPKILKVVKDIKVDGNLIAATSKKEIGGFVDFVRQQGVVGLAVGLAVGTAAGAAVKSIVTGFVNPIVGFLIGGIDLTKLTWVVITPHKNGTGGLVFTWGAIVSSFITLIATAAVIYWIIHLAKLDKLDKPKA